MGDSCHLKSGQTEDADLQVTPHSSNPRHSHTTVPVHSTTMVHYEAYGWPVFFPMMPILAVPWRVWHRRGMEVEMELVKAQIEHIFKEVQKSSADASSLVDASFLAAEYPPVGANDWGRWKYSANEYLKETFAKALCRPYKAH